MDVMLIDFTGKGSKWRAADLMIFSKHTRIKMNASSLGEIEAWPEEKKIAELTYMANTIPSSWEMCDFIYLIQGVTRSLTHQLVRHRHASFAQESLQIADVSDGWSYHIGPSIVSSEGAMDVYEAAMRDIAEAYKTLRALGVDTADARDLLPHGILTSVIMKVNLRTLCEIVGKRESPRNLGEIAVLTKEIRRVTLEALPWTKLFLERTRDAAARDLDVEIGNLDIEKDRRLHIHKLIDQMRQKS